MFAAAQGPFSEFLVLPGSFVVSDLYGTSCVTIPDRYPGFVPRLWTRRQKDAPTFLLLYFPLFLHMGFQTLNVTTT